MGVRGERGQVLFGTPERGKKSGSRAAQGRVCNEPECSTILSTYNVAGTCWLHSPSSYRHSPPRS
jgi:hypothetical protein